MSAWPITARVAPSLGEIDEMLGAGRHAVADCSIGGHGPHGIASELLEQLDPGARSEARSVAPMPDLIDRQGVERAECRACYDHAAAVIRAAGEPATFVVLGPRRGHRWRTVDELALFYLAHLLRGSRSTLILVYAAHREDAVLPRYVAPVWQGGDRPPPGASAALKSGWFPGLGSHELFACLDEQPPHRALANGLALIDPSARAAAVAPTAVELARVLARPALRRRYGRFLMLRAPELFDAAALMTAAWRLFADRDEAPPILVLGRHAVSRATSDVARGRIMLEAQRLRICLRAVDDDIISDDIFERVPRGLGLALAQSKGWLLALKKEPRRSAPYLAESMQVLEATGRTRELLYLRNIAAYNELNLGNLDGALALEERIAAAVAQHDLDDCRLAFLNHLNLSRLHEMRGDLVAAQAQFDECARLLDGYSLPSLQMFVCFRNARLAGARGLRRACFGHWVCCALHWVSSRFPEAIPDRLAAAIDKPPKPDLMQRVDAVATRMLGALRDTLPQELAAPRGRPPAPAFARASEVDVTACGELTAMASPAGSLLASPVAIDRVSLAHASGAFQELAAMLAALIAARSPENDRETRTFIVDDIGDGADPRAALVSSLVRRGATHFVQDRRRHELPASLRAELERHAAVSCHPALAQIAYAGGEHHASFQRFLAPVVVSDDDARVLARCGARPSLEELHRAEPAHVAWPAFVARVRRMEAARLVRVAAPLPPFLALLGASAAPSWEAWPL